MLDRVGCNLISTGFFKLHHGVVPLSDAIGIQ
jgi:hypothetical protein